MNNIEKDIFNPTSLKIKDYETATAYKNDFFVKNIASTLDYYELKLFQAYYIYDFINIGYIFEASKSLSVNNKPEITYRKVNDWSVKGLFEENRNRKIEWRKYSVRTAVQLLLINDLKKYGYSNEQIKHITNQVINENSDVAVGENTYNFRYFDFYASVFFKRGVNFSILIDAECNAYTLCDKDLVANMVDGFDMTKPFLILPFSKYLSVFAKRIFSRENESVITDELTASKELPDENERKILNKVRDDEVKEIKITKKSKDKNSMVMKSKTIKDGEYLTDKDLATLVKKDKYAKTTASNVKGNLYNLSIEQTEKLD